MAAHLCYERSAGQIRRSAPRYLRRAHAAGAVSVQLEDVISEMNVAWCIARDKFDPSLGIPFPAYLARGMQNHINRWIDGQIGHVLGMVSLDAETGAGEDEGYEWLVADLAPRPDEILEEAHVWARVQSELSPEAATFVSLLREPPPALYEEMHAIQVRAEHARSRGIMTNSPKAITGNLVLDLMGVGRVERHRIYSEIRKVANAMTQEITQ